MKGLVLLRVCGCICLRACVSVHVCVSCVCRVCVMCVPANYHVCRLILMFSSIHDMT